MSAKKVGTSIEVFKKPKKKSIFLRYIFTTFKITFALVLAIICAAVGVSGGVIFGFMENTSPLTDEDLIIQNFTTVLYDKNDKELTKLKAAINREWLYIDDIQLTKNAFIAIESTFLNHNGVDLGRIRSSNGKNHQSRRS